MPLAQAAVLLDGPLDEPALQDALRQVIGRHEILRTTFHRVPGMRWPLQVVAAASDVRWRHQVLVTSRREEPAVIDRLLLDERHDAFDLERGPLLRPALVRLGPDRHLLLLTLPSLCADGGTLDGLVSELAQFYGHPHDPGPLVAEPIQYPDFAEWHTRVVEHAAGSPGATFWQQHDAAAPPAPGRLPFERDPRPRDHFETGAVSLNLPGPRAAPTPPSPAAPFLLACWQAFLYRLTGEAAVVIGYASDGRVHDPLKGAFGAVDAVLPIRGSLDDRHPFADLLGEARATLAEVARWQFELPWNDGSPENPYTCEVREQLPARTAREVRWSLVGRTSETSRFRLHLSCMVSESGWTSTLRYDRRAFAPESVERMARHLETLVGCAAREPQTPLGALEVMDADDRRRVLVAFNPQAGPLPVRPANGECIHDLFAAQAARTPDRSAVRCGDAKLSYAELNARANQLAHFLSRHGVGGGTPVGLHLEPSVETVVGLLGILKAGGAYVPLATDLPPARLARLATELGCPVLVTQEALASRWSPFPGEVVRLDGDRARLEREPREPPNARATPADAVYVMYTSGSTGLPKGVAVRHANLAAYTRFMIRRLDATSAPDGLRFASVSPISTDLGNTSIFPALLSGGCLHVFTRELALDGRLFAEAVARCPVDVLKITPSHLNALLESSGGAPILPRRYLILGGEALRWDLLARLARADGACAIINHYGPTETTVGCATFDCREPVPDEWASATVPIGRPIDGARIYLLDRRLEPVPIGVPGELYVGGDGVAAGYWRQPEQTAERFVPDPFSDASEARLYRTGDRARYLPNGAIEFLGRVDDQVKVHGFRVEPGEVEQALRQHPGIRQAVVVAREETLGDRRLVAHVVPSGRSTPAERELREFLKERLPTYMAPHAYVAHQALPLTPAGKIDRRALADVAPTRGDAARPLAPPRSAVETILVRIWGEVLGVERIGIEDNFFDLGGHSLLATQVIARVLGAFRVQVPLRALFEAPTVAELAREITALRASSVPDRAVADLLREIEPLSDAEARRLLAERERSGEAS
jgi:amino acid adenylation domain-containing protein